mgnify:CR=1 FL=1
MIDLLKLMVLTVTPHNKRVHFAKLISLFSKTSKGVSLEPLSSFLSVPDMILEDDLLVVLFLHSPRFQWLGRVNGYECALDFVPSGFSFRALF